LCRACDAHGAHDMTDHRTLTVRWFEASEGACGRRVRAHFLASWFCIFDGSDTEYATRWAEQHQPAHP
jgi:hypothetical protein